MVDGVVVLCVGNGNLVQRDCGQAVNQVGFSSVFLERHRGEAGQMGVVLKRR